MTRVRAFVVAVSFSVGVAFASAQFAPDSTVADPDVHHVVLDNEYVRVLHALAPAGMKSPMHSHPPMLLVSLGTARMRFASPDGKKEIIDLQPGTVLWRPDSLEHSWELLAGEVNIVAVEVKSTKSAKAAKAK
jgi:hypothetical protein